MEQVNHVLRTAHEGLMDLVGDEHSTHGDAAVAQAFGGGDQVGGDIETLCGKSFSDPPVTGNNFIKYQ